MRPKDQGTRFETSIVKAAKARGLKAWRLAEGGEADAGDVVVVDPGGDHWVIEAKHTANLNQHQAVHKAREKTQRADLPFMVYKTVLAHKRSVRKQGNRRRTPDGVSAIVSMEFGDFMDLLIGS